MGVIIIVVIIFILWIIGLLREWVQKIPIVSNYVSIPPPPAFLSGYIPDYRSFVKQSTDA